MGLAEVLYNDKKIRNIGLFFKNVDSGKLADPGKQLEPVLAFKKQIEAEKRYLFHQYGAVTQFAEILEGHLARWLRDHEDAGSSMAVGAGTSSSAGSQIPATAPQFDYWIAEASRLLDAKAPDHAGAIFCALRAIDTATSDIEWAKANSALGSAQFRLGRLDEAFASFAAIAERFSTSVDADRRELVAEALVNKGLTLAALDRGTDAIAAYDDLLARFGTATELPLRELVADALVNKGVTLDALDRGTDAIAAYDDLLVRLIGPGVAMPAALAGARKVRAPVHPNPLIARAVDLAVSLGWRFVPSKGHAWGRLYCGHARPGCIVSVWTTPRDPALHARQIIRAVRTCPHPR